MRLDHITIHTDPDPIKLQALADTLNNQGFPFEPEKGRRNAQYDISGINIGDQYLEVVRLKRKRAPAWMPLWTRLYHEGARGAFCIFLEVEDAERTAVAIKRAGVRVLGPAVFNYPALLGIAKVESPYFSYFLPSLGATPLQLALMQYRKKGAREAFQATLEPNTRINGIQGIRQVDVDLPDLDASLDLLQKVFTDLRQADGGWCSQLEQVNLTFRPSIDASAHLRIAAVSSQRGYLGKRAQVENVELYTIGG